MAIAFVAASNGGESVSDASPFSTAGTGVMTFDPSTADCVVMIFAWQGFAALTGATFDGGAATAMWNFRETIFGIQGVAGFVKTGGSWSGAKAVAATFTGTAGTIAWVGSSWSGVEQVQASCFRTAVTKSINPNLSDSVVVANAVSGDVVVDGVHIGTTVYGTTNQTYRANRDDIAGNNESIGHSSAAASGSTTMQYTYASEQIGALGAAALIPSSGGGGGGQILSAGGILTGGILTGGALVGGNARTRSTVFFPDFARTRKLALL